MPARRSARSATSSSATAWVRAATSPAWPRLAAGLDVAVPGMTIDRQCGSGLAAIITAADAIRAGDGRLRVAGGVESSSTAPTRIADGVAYARAPFAPPGHPDPDMVRAAQDLAVFDGIDRDRQDAYAARSHRLAVRTRDGGGFDAELVAVAGVKADSGPRERIPAMLDRFPPLFPDAGGTLTAGNSCRDSDGAAAVALVPAGSRAGTPGLAIIAAATVGCDPALPGLGPVARGRAAPARGRRHARRHRSHRDRRGLRGADAGRPRPAGPDGSTPGSAPTGARSRSATRGVPARRSAWSACSAGWPAPAPPPARWAWPRPRSAAGSAWQPCSRWSDDRDRAVRRHGRVPGPHRPAGRVGAPRTSAGSP